MRRRCRGPLAIMALVVLVGSCVQDDASDVGSASDDTLASEDASASDTLPSVTSPSQDGPSDPAPPIVLPMLVPGERTPTGDDPLRVALIGDSVMGNLAQALDSVLDDGDQTESDFRLITVLPQSDSQQVVWRDMLDDDDPELIVMLVGGWEDQRAYEIEGRLGSAVWARSYREQVLDPFTELVTSTGAQVLWVGFPPVVNPGSTRTHATLNRVYAELAAIDPNIVFLDSSMFLSDGDGAYTDIIDEAGGSVRLRSTDGSHICPEGVVRLAEPILAMIEGAWSIDVDDTWPDGDWQEGDLLPDPASCEL